MHRKRQSPNPPPQEPEYDGRAPIHYCGCGNVIGDGDWASGRRACQPCLIRSGRSRRRPHWPSPRR